MTEPDHPHEVFCNASRRIPIGGATCSCRAGQEIKQLKHDIERHIENLGSAEDAFDHEVTRRERAEAELEKVRCQLVSAGRWQPIETAPKDGTEVLLWVDCLDRVLAAWKDGRWVETWDDNPLAFSPTCWMPLPEAPQ